jgi:hypothetical protein
VGEIINAQLYAHPRPPGPHVLTASRLGSSLGAACDRALRGRVCLAR